MLTFPAASSNKLELMNKQKSELLGWAKIHSQNNSNVQKLQSLKNAF